MKKLIVLFSLMFSLMFLIASCIPLVRVDLCKEPTGCEQGIVEDKKAEALSPEDYMKRASGVGASKKLDALTELAVTPADDDLFLIRDDNVSQSKKIQYSTMMDGGALQDGSVDSPAYAGVSIDHEHLNPEIISGAPDVTSENADYILIWDDTDSLLKKVDMGEVRGTGGGSGTVDTSGTPVIYDIPRFTDEDTIEGRSYAEIKADLDLEAGTDFYTMAAADTAHEAELNTEAGLYAALSDVDQFYEPGDTLQGGSGTARPGTCTVGEMFLDTDADTDGSLYTCVAADTWKEVDDDGGGTVISVGDSSSTTALDGTATGGTYIRIRDPDSHYMQLQVEDIIADYTLSLPPTVGSNGELMKSDGDGTTSFVSSLTGITIGGFTANKVVQADSSGDLEASGVSNTELTMLSGKLTVAEVGTAQANDYARFTDTETIHGRDYPEMRQDLDLEVGTDFYSMAAADTAHEAELNNSAGLLAALNDPSGSGLAMFNVAPSINNGAASAGYISIYEDSSYGTNYINLMGRDDLPSNWSLRLPPDDGIGKDFLTSDGSGTTRWAMDTKDVAWNIFDSDTAVTTGNGVTAYTVPLSLTNMELFDVVCSVHTQGVTGTTNIQVRRRFGGSEVDMLSVLITIGAEYFASDETIDTANDHVNTGDQIYIDVDTVHSGTAPMGLSCVLEFELP